MFINRDKSGRNNIVGLAVRKYRMRLHISQRELADRLIINGLNIDKNAIQRMESGQRFITDIELTYLTKLFNVSLADLYKDSEHEV